MGVEWFEPFIRCWIVSRGPEWAQWFVGGRLNIAHNCLDRWARKYGRVACILGGRGRGRAEGDVPRIAKRGESSGERADVRWGFGRAIGWRCACRWSRGFLSILYGCFKAGLTVVPIFAGFGSGAIATRVEDSRGAGGVHGGRTWTRRGKALPLAEKMPAGRGTRLS